MQKEIYDGALADKMKGVTMGEVYDIYTTTGGRRHWIDTQTGEHTGLNDVFEKDNLPKMYGWICPVCGRGLSPYTTSCPCTEKWEITC